MDDPRTMSIDVNTLRRLLGQHAWRIRRRGCRRAPMLPRIIGSRFLLTRWPQRGHIMAMNEDMNGNCGMLCDYRTGDTIRDATIGELAASLEVEAQSGAFMLGERSVYVEGGNGLTLVAAELAVDFLREGCTTGIDSEGVANLVDGSSRWRGVEPSPELVKLVMTAMNAVSQIHDGGAK